MIFSFVGGTAQQRTWFNDAISACSYPVNHVAANVTVQWVASMPITVDSRHPYMATHIDSTGPGGSYHIYIEDWADDPTAPGLQGLPNPAADVQTFYMQSVVHEIGHVVTYETFDPGDLIDTNTKLPVAADVAAVCACFFKSVNGARQYGTPASWNQQQLAWPDEIRESVAEAFKTSFYTGRLIFYNRTNWNADSRRWATLMEKIPAPDTGGTGGSPTKVLKANASLKVINIDMWGAGRVNVDAPVQIGYGGSDPPYDESHITFKLQSSSGDGSIELTTIDDDGRYRVDITLAGVGATTFRDGLRPVWLWLTSDFESGVMTAKLTSDAAGDVPVFEFTHHVGPQPATLFSTDLYIKQATGTPDRAAVTDWTFDAPGQSLANALGALLPGSSFTEDFSNISEVNPPWHLVEIDDVTPPAASGLMPNWSWTSELKSVTSAPFNSLYVPPDAEAPATVELIINSISDPFGQASASPPRWQGTSSPVSLTISDLIDDGSPIGGATPIEEEWQLYAFFISFINPEAALSEVAASEVMSEPPGFPYPPLGLFFSLQFDEVILASGQNYGGAGSSLATSGLPALGGWYVDDGGGGWTGGADPEGQWFGRAVHWSAATGAWEWYTGIWSGEPLTAEQIPDVVLAINTGTSAGPPPAAGSSLSLVAGIDTNVSGINYGLDTDTPASSRLVSWEIGPGKVLEKYRGRRTIELQSNVPTQGPSPVPVTAPYQGTIVEAKRALQGAVASSRPKAGILGKIAGVKLR